MLHREKVRHPGPFTVLLHQAACPDHVAVGADRLRLIDFELARPSRALIDGLYPQSPFPTCWYCNMIPDDLSAELAAEVPEVADQTFSIRRLPMSPSSGVDGFGRGCPRDPAGAMARCIVAPALSRLPVDRGRLIGLD